MLRLGCVLVLALVSPVTAQPKGKVVRVERARTFETTPIICSLRQRGERYCFGPQPKTGDVVRVVDDKTLLAEYRIDAVRAATKSCEVMWQVDGEVLRGQLGSSGAESVGLIDASADPRTLRQIGRHDLRSPVVDPEVKAVLGLDRNGDGDADIVITQTRCAQAGPHGRGECYDFWVKRDRVMKSVFSADIQACFQ